MRTDQLIDSREVKALYLGDMYRFEDLQHELPGESFSREELYALSERMMDDTPRTEEGYDRITTLLREKLQEDRKYYLMHERMLYKGKIVKYIGVVVIASGRNILPFMRDALQRDDLRPMRILPVDEPQWLLWFTDESVLKLYEAQPRP